MCFAFCACYDPALFQHPLVITTGYNMADLSASNFPDLLEQASFSAPAPHALDFPGIRGCMDELGFVRVRGLFSHQEIRALLNRVQKNFNPSLDRKHDADDAEALRNPLQKVVVGGLTGINNCARLIRTFFLPLSGPDLYGSHDIFRRLARFRNLLCNEPENFAIDQDERGLWTASRIHHYPRGGGFMAEHSDFGTAVAAADAGFDRFAQVILIISQKGLDFHTGGAFIRRGNDRFFYEDACVSGDIVVYDGRIRHGVADIDAHEPFQFDSIQGRLVGFATLYKRFTKTNTEYKELLKGYAG